METGNGGRNDDRGDTRESAPSSPANAPNGTTAGTPGEPPRRRGRRGWIIGGAIALGLLFLTVGSVVAVLLAGTIGGGSGSGTAAQPPTFEEEYVTGEGSDKVAVVPVVGTIGDAASGGALGGSTADPQTLRDQLRQAAEDESVRAVVLEVNSPGGGVTASDEMRDAVVDFKREARKPVVVHMGSTAASGGYYVSAPADVIVANETTLTGSLGAVLPLTNFSEAAEKYGVRQEYIKSGEFKDIGSSWNEITPEEREILQSYVDDGFDRFVEVIVEGRGLSEERVREIADGRIYSGPQALELDLVDELGDFDRAVEVAREKAGVEEATAVRYVQTASFTELLGARLAPRESEAVSVMREAGLDTTPQLQYMYRP
jgi:protease-4